jgi:hypothetical protein
VDMERLDGAPPGVEGAAGGDGAKQQDDDRDLGKEDDDEEDEEQEDDDGIAEEDSSMSEVSEPPVYHAEDAKYFSISLPVPPPPVAGEDVVATRATPRCFLDTAALETEALDASPVPEGILLVNAASLCRFVNSTILLSPTFSRARARIKEISSTRAGGHKHVFLMQRTPGATPEVFIPATALVGWLLALRRKPRLRPLCSPRFLRQFLVPPRGSVWPAGPR